MPLRIVFVFILALAALLPSARAASNELRVLETNHYRIHTDLDRSLAEDLARRMDAMYEEYARRLANFDVDRSGKKFDVYLFNRREDYLKFTGGRANNTAGITIPELNTVAAYLQTQGRDNLRHTLQHEAFHQFAHSVINNELPPWIDEGLAGMFEEGIWTGRAFLLGQVPQRRVRQLQADIATKRVVDFKTMMAMPLKEWNQSLEKDKVRGGTQYNQAWSMCHFLVYAGADGHPKYRARFLDLLQRIHGNTPPMQAFEEAFSSNIDGFKTRWLQWAGDLQPTPEATLMERQDILADMLIKFLQENRRFNALDDFRDFLVSHGIRMQYSNGDLKWATDSDPRVYFRTLEGRGYNSGELYFDTRSGAPLPDLVLNSPGELKLRSRFYDLPHGEIEHELIVEGR